MELSKENARLLPLVAVGLVMAAAEVYVKPFIEDCITVCKSKLPS